MQREVGHQQFLVGHLHRRRKGMNVDECLHQDQCSFVVGEYDTHSSREDEVMVDPKEQIGWRSDRFH